MRCEEALELISAALDGELTAQERRELDDHLAGCPDCAALFDELAGQSRLLRDLDCEMPSDLTDRILSQLPDQQAGTVPAKPRRALHWRRWGTLAACLALAVWAGLSLPGQTDRAAADNMPAAYSLQDSAPSASVESSAPTESFDDFAEAKSFGQGQFTAQAENAPGGVQYLRTTWTDSAESLTAQYLSTYTDLTDYLAQYPEDDLTVVAECYDADYFESAALIAVPFEEISGSATPTVAEVVAVDAGYEVIIRRETPDAATEDMSSWLILIEAEAVPETTAAAAGNDGEPLSETAQEEIIYVLVEDQ